MKYIKRDYSEIHPGHNWDRALYSKNVAVYHFE